MQVQVLGGFWVLGAGCKQVPVGGRARETVGTQQLGQEPVTDSQREGGAKELGSRLMGNLVDCGARTGTPRGSTVR